MAMQASALSDAIQTLRVDDVAEFVDTMRSLGELLKFCVGGDQGLLLRDELLGARIYEAAVTHMEAQGITGWSEADTILDSWFGRKVELFRVRDGLMYYGKLAEDTKPDEGYKHYSLRDREAGPVYFSFNDILVATVNPDGKRYIIIG